MTGDHREECRIADWIALEGARPKVLTSSTELARGDAFALCVLDLKLIGDKLATLAAFTPCLGLLDLADERAALAFLEARGDLLFRPLVFRELRLRVAALLGRSARHTDLRRRPGLVPEVRLDEREHEVAGPIGCIKLRHLEFEILSYLIQNAVRWVASSELLAIVLKACGDGGSVRTHVWQLRMKLKEIGAAQLIASERGRGYRAIVGQQA